MYDKEKEKQHYSEMKKLYGNKNLVFCDKIIVEMIYDEFYDAGDTGDTGEGAEADEKHKAKYKKLIEEGDMTPVGIIAKALLWENYKTDMRIIGEIKSSGIWGIEVWSKYALKGSKYTYEDNKKDIEVEAVSQFKDLVSTLKLMNIHGIPNKFILNDKIQYLR